jgi:hypothetical protein
MSDRILAVKVDLLPDYHYRILIGNPSGNTIMSKAGVELPVTVWSCKTGSGENSKEKTNG